MICSTMRDPSSRRRWSSTGHPARRGMNGRAGGSCRTQRGRTTAATTTVGEAVVEVHASSLRGRGSLGLGHLEGKNVVGLSQFGVPSRKPTLARLACCLASFS